MKVGDKYGYWTVLEVKDTSNKTKNSSRNCIAMCDCGLVKSVARETLLHNHNPKCHQCASKTKRRRKGNLKAGEQRGIWIIIEPYLKDKPRYSKCKCCVCGNTETISRSALYSKNISKYKGCKRCYPKSIAGEQNKRWLGYKEISGQIWANIKRHAKSRNFAFEISIEDAWDLFENVQKRKCALTGLPIFFAKSQNRPTTASLDRINSKKGYVKGNLHWVHKRINVMKWNFTMQQFIGFCKLVAKHNS